MDDLILIVTNQSETAIGHVSQWLEEFGQKYIRINTDLFIAEENAVTLGLRDTNFRAIVDQQGRSVDITNVKSVWHRRPERPKGPTDVTPVETEFMEHEFHHSFWSLYTILSGNNVFWMNDPLYGIHLLEHNKMYQLKIASSVGIKTPHTLITNSPEELIAFCETEGGEVAVKGVRSRMIQQEDGECVGIYTNRISLSYLRENSGDICLAPVMAQSYVPKKLELRVTVVGNEVFTCAIHSQDSEKTRDDWRRYDFENVKHEPYELPDDLKQKLLSFMNRCGITFGAIDLVLTPDNEYVFLEVNPSGQFNWIEGLTGLPISRAIAKALATPPK